MQNYTVHAYVISMEFSAVNRRRPSRETPIGPGAKKDGCFRRLKSHSFAAFTRSISDTSPTRVKIPYAHAFHKVISIYI